MLLADGAPTVGWGKLFGALAVFFYKNGGNSETKSRRIDPKVSNQPTYQGLRAIDNIRGPVAKTDSQAEIRIIGPKKNIHFLVGTMF